jgi:hypothetical protein
MTRAADPAAAQATHGGDAAADDTIAVGVDAWGHRGRRQGDPLRRIEARGSMAPTGESDGGRG